MGGRKEGMIKLNFCSVCDLLSNTNAIAFGDDSAGEIMCDTQLKMIGY